MNRLLIPITSLLIPMLAIAALPQPAPFPIFLRLGFSSVLEFEEVPTQVVLGDSQAFQVERLNQSLIIRTLAAYATTNMFVYFKDIPPKLFVITASEEAEPTYFRKIEAIKAPTPAPSKVVVRAAQLPAKAPVSAVEASSFDPKKDYLVVELKLAADSSKVLRPNWELVRLRYLTQTIAPFKLWSERKEIQKDSQIRVRLIFAKPNIPLDLTDTVLIVPMDGELNPISLSLKGTLR